MSRKQDDREPKTTDDRKPGPPLKNERRETAERLSEKMGGDEARKARKALREDPELSRQQKPKS